MSGFTKLVPEILQSSIWNESPEVRVVWITMLAAKDENGYVRGDSRTIARLANVPLPVVEEAIDKFQAPDAESHTPENDGRRIAKAAGGWIVLNHELYRIKDERAEHAAYVRKWRQDRCKMGDVKKCDSLVNHSSASASASASVLSGSSPEGECRGGTGSTLETHVMPPDGWEWPAVHAIAEQPTVAVPEAIAREYFDSRTATQWIDAAGRPAARTRKALESDLRKWKVGQPSHGKRQPVGKPSMDIDAMRGPFDFTVEEAAEAERRERR